MLRRLPADMIDNSRPEGVDKRLVAGLGIILGLVVTVYYIVVLLPAIARASDIPPPDIAAFQFFPKCAPDLWYTTRGVLPPVDAFLCVVVPFFQKAVQGSPLAECNTLVFTLLAVILSFRVLYCFSSRGVVLPYRMDVWLPCFVLFLGQIIGLSVCFPMMVVPAYVWYHRHWVDVQLPWYALYGLAVRCTLGIALGVALRTLPPQSTMFLVFANIFQWAPLAFIPVVVLARKLPPMKPGQTDRMLAGLYNYFGGFSILMYLFCVFIVLAGLANGLSAGQVLTKFWNDLHVRFLFVEHITISLCAFLMIAAESGSAAALRVLAFMPLYTLPGAICFHFARLHGTVARQLRKTQ